jgi:hypothetical protein
MPILSGFEVIGRFVPQLRRRVKVLDPSIRAVVEFGGELSSLRSH